MTNWIQGAIKRPGAFKKKAKAAGMTTPQYASSVLKPGSTADTRTKRQASLSRTLAGLRPAARGGKMVRKKVMHGYKAGGKV